MDFALWNRYVCNTSGFTNGVTYQFAVSAQNSVGWSEYSSIVTATPYAPITAPTARETCSNSWQW